ncbi:acetoacetate decarboxylase [Nocardioides guangzhouensis]|uniref:Acetoacetate decarboxylase n=1 Tax=Nocardioides guangzhouensis TaxID=2497878 RepID=A0A4Q4ZEA9_9ACTN|nr:acetoacetate decarboxylase family protein [Nocardioides guangzhouensis]RYP86412.1 acetoacetate decarboxylase [Nocardioides guangzhouensis]
MPHPPAPWRLHGDMWLSLFRVRRVSTHRDGLYGAAWVRYREPSSLTYHELLVARLADVPQRRVPVTITITEIWVDSPDSLEGGRALWAIPKDLADFGLDSSASGPVRRTSWHAGLDNRPIAGARFTDVSALAPPVPFRFRTHQTHDERTGGPTGTLVEARVAGRGRALPARSHWEFAPNGPLAHLAGARPVASFTITDFALTFG